ncbi:MAG TPA: TetR/AcrR family transcriptional regulator [Solirubrobacteraceae bacterium]|nr:TetR/AcrR family transcriptional regulator [Solirubrobacteraceae bacterium]
MPGAPITDQARAERQSRRGAQARRGHSRAATRTRLLDAARRVIARAGYHGASVEEIAAEAGFSTGALYSNFDGKADLFVALMEREIDAHSREIGAAVEGRPSVSARAREGAQEWMATIEREPELLLLFMEFWAYGVRDPAMRAHVAERFAHVRALLTRLILRTAEDFGLELALPAEQLAVVIDALADGIARQKLADPQAVPDDLLGRAIALLLEGGQGER